MAHSPSQLGLSVPLPLPRGKAPACPRQAGFVKSPLYAPYTAEEAADHPMSNAESRSFTSLEMCRVLF
jgi:hypothetical protein